MLLLAIMLLSSIFATVPIIFFLWLIWWLDRYDREPIWLVGLTFLWGAIGGVAFALIFSTIIMVPAQMVLDPAGIDFLGAVIVAPLIEEPGKALILLLIIFSRHFDNTTDGFVYGAACGLGFGMTENFMYFVSVGDTGDIGAMVATIVVRTLYSAVMHACASSVIGASLGFVKYSGWGLRIVLPPIGLAAAIGIHALWNGLLTVDSMVGADGLLAVMNFLLFPLEFLMLFIIFQGCLWQERRLLRRELDGEVPDEHLPYLASYLKRNKKTWLPSSVPHGEYVESATRLAFRKHQHRSRPSASKEREISTLRRDIGKMLAA